MWNTKWKTYQFGHGELSCPKSPPQPELSRTGSRPQQTDALCCPDWSLLDPKNEECQRKLRSIICANMCKHAQTTAWHWALPQKAPWISIQKMCSTIGAAVSVAFNTLTAWQWNDSKWQGAGMAAQPAGCIAGFHSRSGLLTISQFGERCGRRRPRNLHGSLMFHLRCPAGSALNKNTCASHLQNFTRKQCQFSNTSEKLKSLSHLIRLLGKVCGLAYSLGECPLQQPGSIGK